jgi:hypothetical protein
MPATNVAVLADELTNDVRTALKPSMDGLATDMQRDMRTLISIDVQHVGGKIVRSKRGEPPRRETKALTRSMLADVVTEGDGLTARMGSDESIADYAKYLEGKLNRPHFATVYDYYVNHAVDRILSRLPQTI